MKDDSVATTVAFIFFILFLVGVFLSRSGLVYRCICCRVTNNNYCFLEYSKYI